MLQVANWTCTFDVKLMSSQLKLFSAESYNSRKIWGGRERRGNESMFEEKTWKKLIWPDFLRQIIPEPWGFNYKVSFLLIS